MTRATRLEWHRREARERWHKAVSREDWTAANKAIRYVNLWETAKRLGPTHAVAKEGLC